MRIILTTKTKEKLEKELKRAQALNNLRLYKMVLCILLVHKQYTMKKTSEILNVSSRTVYIWLTMFMVKGFYWLLMFRYQGRGRKSKLSKAEKEKLYNGGIALTAVAARCSIEHGGLPEDADGV